MAAMTRGDAPPSPEQGPDVSRSLWTRSSAGILGRRVGRGFGPFDAAALAPPPDRHIRLRRELPPIYTTGQLL